METRPELATTNTGLIFLQNSVANFRKKSIVYV